MIVRVSFCRNGQAVNKTQVSLVEVLHLKDGNAMSREDAYGNRTLVVVLKLTNGFLCIVQSVSYH